MATVERFEDLDVWKRARELGNLIHSFSESGDFRRDFGLRDQMRRAVVSIMSNIAEGFESRTQALFPVYPISRNTPKRAKSRRRAGSL